MKHLGHLGLATLPETTETAVAPSRFTTAAANRKAQAAAKVALTCAIDDNTIAAFARAGFAPPTDPEDTIPTKYISMEALSVKLLKKLTSSLERATLSETNLNHMIHHGSEDNNKKK